jgi:hypothetical protein
MILKKKKSRKDKLSKIKMKLQKAKGEYSKKQLPKQYKDLMS